MKSKVMMRKHGEKNHNLMVYTDKIVAIEFIEDSTEAYVHVTGNYGFHVEREDAERLAGILRWEME